MKDMNFPLDIVWLKSSKKVVYIEQNVSPDTGIDKTYYPHVPARYVLEMSAGNVKSKNIKLGQVATVDYDKEAVE